MRAPDLGYAPRFLSFFLARPRELRGKIFKGIVLIGSPHLTKRAPDAGESARFQAFFSPQLFSHSDGVPPSAPARVTQTVGRSRKS